MSSALKVNVNGEFFRESEIEEHINSWKGDLRDLTFATCFGVFVFLTQKLSFQNNIYGDWGVFGAGSLRQGKCLHPPCSKENRYSETEALLIYGKCKSTKIRGEKSPDHKIYKLWHSLAEIVQGNTSGNPSPRENTTGYASWKGHHPTPAKVQAAQLQAAQPAPVLSRVRLDVKVWETLKQGRYSGVGSSKLLLCELLSHLQWCPHGRLGMETTAGNRAQDRRTQSPATLGLCACCRSRCHLVLNMSGCSKGKIKIHLLKKGGFVITKRFFQVIKIRNLLTFQSTVDGGHSVSELCKWPYKTQEFLLSFSICINHTSLF